MADDRFALFISLLLAVLLPGCQSPPPAVCGTVGAAQLVSRIEDVASRAQAKAASGSLDDANLLVLQMIKEATAAHTRLSESTERTNTIEFDDRGLVLVHADYSDRQGMHEEATQERLRILLSYMNEIRTSCQITKMGTG